MTIDPEIIRFHGDALYEAFVSGSTIPPLRARVPGMTIVDAYHIAGRMIERRVEAGETVVGKKIGVTSKAVQDAIGVFEPDFGLLTSGMALSDDAVIALDTLIQPQAEAEIAFVLKSDLKGPGITPEDVLNATDYVCPCFEIVDSRIERWDIKILDTVADNASCGVFVLGDSKVDPRDIELDLVGMIAMKNGELASTGVGAAVQGSPLNAVAWLADTLGKLGMPLLAGEVILSGSLGPLMAIGPGDSLHMRVGGIGTCSVRFE
ncbi:fumarylacetoacetate hydrolase family protein [Novosphingobium sp. PP1Y]|uniref:fumarylacetoacetate hydrolase family protein n=1 Tax=Novosphingobium sp. PP1Y TaxID=702113 RepID=UPI00020EF366|nr:fumarylacetoacetate hydrolase family protein [Novosphingobium sp. PP1Y]CCA94009.1 2-oxo-hept-3-ene-1,7-dioate hydratase [Novosphingobium sp. PP1Y]